MSTPKECRVADEVENTLRAFDDDIPLRENPFLASKIRVLVNSRVHGRNDGFSLSIILRYGAVVLILLINLITAVHFF